MADRKMVENRGVEIDLKRLAGIVAKQRYVILLLTLLFGFFAYLYAYLQVNIYETKTTVEVGRGSIIGGRKGDVLSSLSDSMSLDTEFDIIRSRLVTDMALKEVDWRHRYFVKTKLKEWELYDTSPFRVEMKKGIGLNFFLYPSSNPHTFRLQVRGRDSSGSWEVDKGYRYGEVIRTPHFELTVERVKKNPLVDGRYRFYVMNELAATMSALSGISVGHGEGYSSVFTISNRDTVPRRARDFLNAMARAYMKQNIEKKTREASKMLAFIDAQLREINQSLHRSASNLEHFKKSTNTAEISTKTRLIITKMSGYRSRLIDVSIEEKMLDALLKQVKKGEKLETLSIAGVKINGGALLELVQELQQTVVKRNALLLDYTRANRKIEKLNNTIRQISSVIIDTLKNMKLSIAWRKALIGEALGEYEKRLKKLPTNEKIYSRLERNYQINQEIYSYLLKKRSETAIVKASTVSKNRIIDEALLPSSPIRPNRRRIVLAGIMLGLLLGIAYAFLRDFFDDTIKSEEDVRRLTAIPILGKIPHIRSALEGVAVFEDPKSLVSEAFRTLRTNLQYMSAVEHSEVIALTSMIGSEGKTTIAANLGASMSLAGKRTIILNLDLRKPTMAKLFGLENNRGMSSLLSERATLKEIIQPTMWENLFLVSSGPIPPNPTELIQGRQFEKLLTVLRNTFDVIILDTPPVGVVADAMSLMHLADTTIFVLRANYSKRIFAGNVQRLKEENGISGLGILINDVEYGLAYGYGYGYKSYGYGYYGREKR